MYKSYIKIISFNISITKIGLNNSEHKYLLNIINSINNRLSIYLDLDDANMIV